MLSEDQQNEGGCLSLLQLFNQLETLSELLHHKVHLNFNYNELKSNLNQKLKSFYLNIQVFCLNKLSLIEFINQMEHD